MPKTTSKILCSVCRHPAREAIEAALLQGETRKSISQSYGISPSTLTRHKKHMDQYQQRIHTSPAHDAVQSQRQCLCDLQNLALEIIKKAKKGKDPAAALAGIREFVRLTTLLAKLPEGGAQTRENDFLHSSTWRELRTAILAALEPYPESRLAVIHALQSLHK
ncbi:MAG TPA: hypothetical protein DCY27_04220 [Desulfobacterales bacterium]|nr:hypothetical protein [Desulfobacterales bacterium]